MSQALYIFPSCSSNFDTARPVYCTTVPVEAGETPEHADGRFGRSGTEVEAIVEELVGQYFRGSTRISGIFLGW